MRFTQVIGGITAALLVSGVPAIQVPKRQDDPPETLTPVPPVETPEPPVSSTADPLPPAPVETCTAHLLVDDFSQWENGENLLAGATSGK